MSLRPITDQIEFGASCKRTGYMTFDSPTMCGFVSPGRKIDSDFDFILYGASIISELIKDKLFIHDDHVALTSRGLCLLSPYLIGLSQINSSPTYKHDGQFKTIEKDITKDYMFLLERN